RATSRLRSRARCRRSASASRTRSRRSTRRSIARDRSRRLSSAIDPDLVFAHELADLADSLSLPRFRAADLRIDTKPDLTPVSDADRAVEEALRAAIAERRPGEG